MSATEKITNTIRDVANKKVRTSFSLRTLMFLMLMCSILLSWWLDRNRLNREIAKLSHELRMANEADINRSQDILVKFASNYQGNVLVDQDYSINLDMRNTLVGNTQLNQIRDPMRHINSLSTPKQRYLDLYGTRVTPTFVAELRRELDHWEINTDAPKEGALRIDNE